MTKAKSTRRPQLPANPVADDSADPAVSSTAARLRAFLESMQSLPDCNFEGRREKTIQSGRALIEQLAASATDDDPPTYRLSLTQAIDVLIYLGASIPRDSQAGNWWKDPEHGPSHVVGYYHVLDAIREGLTRQTQEAVPSGILERRLETQRSRVLSARGISALAAQAALKGEDSGGLDCSETLMLRSSLEGLGELLDSIKDAISPEEALAPASEEEREMQS